MEIQRIDHIVLTVADIEKTIQSSTKSMQDFFSTEVPARSAPQVMPSPEAF
jgi:hypothetical protein